MRGILPGRPQAKLQAVCHGLWEGYQVIVRQHRSGRNTFGADAQVSQAYITGNALVILDRPNHVLQTIYVDEEFELEAVALDEGTGKLAVCSKQHIYIYRPYGQDEGVVKV